MAGTAASSTGLLWRIALRNLTSHRVKTAIVGSIMAFGTMLVVVGSSLLDSVEASMQKVVTSSLTGQLQVYSSQGKDELSMFGGLTASQPDIGEIEDFASVKAELEQVDNVAAVVPMGMGIAIGAGGNDIDQLLGRLRRAVADGDDATIRELERQLRQIAALQAEEYEYRARISSDRDKIERDRATLKRVQADAFWEAIPGPEAQDRLMYLDTRLAPLLADADPFFLRYLGTDPQLFQRSFDRFYIDKGQMIPPKRRGLLLSKRAHERFMKHKIARELDRIKQEIEQEGRSLKDDELLQGRVRRMARQYKRIIYQLDTEESAELEAWLRAQLPGQPGELPELIEAFLLVDHTNFYERYELFYEHIAPRIELYRVRVGDVVAIQSYTRRGYVKAVNLKVWGTFQFEGLEDSDLAGVVNLTDMLTFRELYGKMTAEQRAELAEIRQEVGVEALEREVAEDTLFGGGGDDEEAGGGGLMVDGAQAEAFDEFADVEVMERQERQARAGELTYTQEQLEEGLALHAAIILEDPSRIEQTQRALERRIDEAGLQLEVVDWQSAAGIVGQLVIVIRLVLYVAIAIIFLVALVIINNSMVMATMERVAEIGTMRAIGARRGFILAMFLTETLMLSLIAGALGGLLGAGAVELAGVWGIPATNEIVRFIFAGSHLYPHVRLGNVLLAAAVIFVVSVVATLYPAIVATRIQPVVAMRGRE